MTRRCLVICTVRVYCCTRPFLSLFSSPFTHGRNNDRAGEPGWRALTKSVDRLKLTALAATTVGAPTNMSFEPKFLIETVTFQSYIRWSCSPLRTTTRVASRVAPQSASSVYCSARTTASQSMWPTRSECRLRRTTKMPRHGSSTTITSRGCSRCSKRSTVRALRIPPSPGSFEVPDSLLLRRRDATARERMIGWYHTGPKLRASDLEINELFKRYIARPVMVIVDVRPQTVGIPTDAYFAVEEIKDVGVPRDRGPIFLTFRMRFHRTAPKHVKLFFMRHRPSRRRRQKR
jgi:proteasome lid subunit RPN8/RPN11